MYYSLANFPDIDKEKINRFRAKYSPFAKNDFHITLVFPIKFPCEITEKQLIEHTESKLNDFKPFNAHLVGLEKSWDHWLFLLLKEGNSEVTKLHDTLYTGILEKYLRKDIEFIPHIGLGVFTKKDSNYDVRNPKQLSLDKSLYEKALYEAKELKMDYVYTFDKVTLIKLNNNFTKLKKIKEFQLTHIK